MDSLFWVNVLMRWLHVTAAVVGVGGAIFLWLVLRPAVAAADPETARPVMEGVYRRFKGLIHSAIGLLLLSGAYNLFMVIPRANALESMKPLYHSLLGTKILLALVLFGIAFALLSDAPGLVRLAVGRSRALTAGITLALLILLLSASLRRMWDYAAPPPAPRGAQPAIEAPEVR